MPKSLMIRPDEVRRPHTVEFDPIPANQYSKTMADELKGRIAAVLSRPQT